MRSLQTVLMLTACACIGAGLWAQDAELSPDAPPDRPFSVDEEERAKLHAAIQPFIQKARETYPGAKERYLLGLPAGEIFFVTTRLEDAQDRHEQVFIRVTDIEDGSIAGTIASDIWIVSGYQYGDSYAFRESDLLDWLIAKPDGSEEGNFVGKFLDKYQETLEAE